MASFSLVFLVVALISSANVSIMATDSIFGSGFPNISFSIPTIRTINVTALAESIKNVKPSKNGSQSVFSKAVSGPNGTDIQIITNNNGTVTEINRKLNN